MGAKPETSAAKSKKKSISGSESKTKKTQRERFIEAARSVGVDESGKEFERAMKKVVPPKTSG